MESSFNQGVKICFNLPVSTHRNIIEPVTKSMHIRKTLIARLLGFVHQIKSSDKRIPKLLLSHIIHDVRSTTGKNLRTILLQTRKNDVDELIRTDFRDVSYHPLSDDDKWKGNCLNELIDIRDGKLLLEEFHDMEIDDLIADICTA